MELYKYISLTVGEPSSQQAALRWEERAPHPRPCRTPHPCTPDEHPLQGDETPNTSCATKLTVWPAATTSY